MQTTAMPIDHITRKSNNALLLAFAKGNTRAARVLSDSLLPKIYARAFHQIRNQADAEDIAQEAVFRLWRMAPDWKKDGASVSTWLYQVVKNFC